MPELGDVDGFKRVLAEHAAGYPIRHVMVSDASVLHETAVATFEETLHGDAFGPPWRHGKWLIAPMERNGSAAAPAVLFHFGMTGELQWAEDGQPRHRHDRIIFGFDDGALCYRDMRKLKGLRLTDTDEVLSLLADLGPDAARITKSDFTERLSGLAKQVKSTLTDQESIAGLGNLMADEICWRARIHPRQRLNTLSDSAVRRLHTKMGSVVRSASRAGCVPGRPSWLTGHRDDDPGQCPRCGADLEHGRVNGRGTVWCPQCQPG